jgi:peptidoglycan/LPS O-acetylase OafA/YrhL
MRDSYYANLDLLRAIAVLLVVAQHFCEKINVQHIGWAPIGSLGLFGVLLFFVHTSLVLMGSMERSGLRGVSLLKDFYTRRIFRIYPLSILAIACALALHLGSDVNGTSGLSYAPLPGKIAIVSQILLIQNLVDVRSIVNVLWTLPLEMQMYLFLPFLFAWIRSRAAFWPLIALWIASVFAARLQLHVAALSRASLLEFVPCFIPGVIAFASPRTPRLGSYLWPIFIIGLLSAFTLHPVTPMRWVLCLILGLFIPLFREIQTKSVRMISNRIATYSYGIYISHQFCLWFALGALVALPVWFRAGVLAALLIAVPILLYHGIEKPMIEIGNRLAKRWHEKPSSVLAIAD